MSGLIWVPPRPPSSAPTAAGQFVWRAAYSVHVAWARELAGWFLLDTSDLDENDTLSPALLLVPPFDGRWDDLTRFDGDWPVHVQDLSWQRGRTQTLDSVQTGSATVTVIDRNGLLNPSNEASPLYRTTSRPGWFLRIRAQLQGEAWQDQFLGFVRALDYQPSPRGGVATIEADDLLARLDRDQPVIGTTTMTTTGAAIGKVLDHLGWTDPDYRDLATGDAITAFSVPADTEDTGLSVIGELLATELGLFYIAKDGAAVFEERIERSRKRDPDWTIAGGMRAVGPGTDLTRIVNKATFTKTGGNPQTYTDQDSADPIRGYGLNAAPAVESAWLNDDEDALQRARYIVAVKKDPRGPLWNLDLDSRDLTVLRIILQAELSDLAAVSEAQTGTTGRFFVERIQRDVTFAPYRDAAVWTLSEQGALAFTLDVSGLAPFLADYAPLDGPDGLDLAPPQPALDVLPL